MRYSVIVAVVLSCLSAEASAQGNKNCTDVFNQCMDQCAKGPTIMQGPCERHMQDAKSTCIGSGSWSLHQNYGCTITNVPGLEKR
jgi:hypothetical protein